MFKNDAKLFGEAIFEGEAIPIGEAKVKFGEEVFIDKTLGEAAAGL